MRGSAAGSMIAVTMSRKNLNQLLSALDEGSTVPILSRRQEDGSILYIAAEEDEIHYADRPEKQVVSIQETE